MSKRRIRQKEKERRKKGKKSAGGWRPGSTAPFNRVSPAFGLTRQLLLFCRPEPHVYLPTTSNLFRFEKEKPKTNRKSICTLLTSAVGDEGDRVLVYSNRKLNFLKRILNRKIYGNYKRTLAFQRVLTFLRYGIIKRTKSCAHIFCYLFCKII